MSRKVRINITWGLLHIGMHLQNTKGILKIKLVERPTINNCKRKNNTNSGRLDHWAESVSVLIETSGIYQLHPQYVQWPAVGHIEIWNLNETTDQDPFFISCNSFLRQISWVFDPWLKTCSRASQTSQEVGRPTVTAMASSERKNKRRLKICCFLAFHSRNLRFVGNKCYNLVLIHLFLI